MKKWILVIMSLCLFIFVLGCTSKGQSASYDITGYVVKVEGTKRLVVSQLPLNGGHYDAIWVTASSNDQSKVGQKVGVIVPGPRGASFPSSGVAKSIDILHVEKIGNEKQSQEEILRTTFVSVKDWIVPAVLRVSFDQEKKIWEIQIKDAGSNDVQTRTVHIKDETGEIVQ